MLPLLSEFYPVKHDQIPLTLITACNDLNRCISRFVVLNSPESPGNLCGLEIVYLMESSDHTDIGRLTDLVKLLINAQCSGLIIESIQPIWPTYAKLPIFPSSQFHTGRHTSCLLHILTGALRISIIT